MQILECNCLHELEEESKLRISAKMLAELFPPKIIPAEIFSAEFLKISPKWFPSNFFRRNYFTEIFGK